MPQSSDAWLSEVDGDQNVKARHVYDGIVDLQELFRREETKTGAVNPFFPVGSPPLVARLHPYPGYLTAGVSTSDGYFNFGDAAAWSATHPGLPEDPIAASTIQIARSLILDKLFILPPHVSTTLKKLEGRLVLSVRADNPGEGHIDDVDIVLWKLKPFGGGSPVILNTTNIAVGAATSSAGWNNVGVDVSIDYGAGHLFSNSFPYPDRIAIGIKTYGHCAAGATETYHGIGVFPSDVVATPALGWPMPQRSTFAFYLE